MLNRRQFLKLSLAAGAGFVIRVKADGLGGQLGGELQAEAAPAAEGLQLSDPALQPKFANLVPDAMAPGFKFVPNKGKIKVAAGPSVQYTGLLGPGGTPVPTPVWGYGDTSMGYTWPGRTFEVKSGEPLEVKWENDLKVDHLLPVDTTLHWAYSLPGYTQYSIAKDGVPVVMHLHGGHTDFQFDGNPEFFFSPGYTIRGPQWVDKKYVYDNSQPAGNLWYHDHALGITRLNVYAGLAGFYFIRDANDTGLPGNPLGLPAWPYEKAYAIQDRMFLETGELFYPAFPGDPYYEGFIDEEDADLPPDLFPGGGPTALAEFFGDHMVVNGVIWPKEDVEPRNYRLHLLNGTDSRFMALQLFEVPAGATDFSGAIQQLDFTVIGSDQGLASSPTTLDTLLSEPGSRYDIIVDFKNVTPGNRVIMKNIGGDEPFGGDIPGPQIFGETDRVMAFDVVLPLDAVAGRVPTESPSGLPSVRPHARAKWRSSRARTSSAPPAPPGHRRTRDGLPGQCDQLARYPCVRCHADLVGQMEGSIAWHSPTTENPALGDTEEWEIWNATGDAHPVHLHLVHFEVLGRKEIVWDSHTTEDERVYPK